MILWQRLAELTLFFLLPLAAAGWGWLGLGTWAWIALRLGTKEAMQPFQGKRSTHGQKWLLI